MTIEIDITPFNDADELKLTELCDPLLGGGLLSFINFRGERNKPGHVALRGQPVCI